MLALSRKKIAFIGILLVLFIAIPLTVYMAQQQQQTETQAAKATILSLNAAIPTVEVGTVATMDVMLNPTSGGSNIVSVAQIVIGFDPTKFETTDESFVLNPASRLSIIQGPTYGTDTISVTLSVSSPQDVIQTLTKIGTLNLKATSPTVGAPTKVIFKQDQDQTQVRSLASADGRTENVLSSTVPADITITGEAAPTEAPTATPTATLTLAPTAEPVGGDENLAPVCELLEVDVEEGTAPLTVNFNASGYDEDGTVGKITFNFGDSSVKDVVGHAPITATPTTTPSPTEALSATITTTSTPTATLTPATDSSTNTEGLVYDGQNASTATTHTYNSPGTYTATAVLTDDQGSVSDPSECTQTITVSVAVGGPSSTPTPTLAPTGPDIAIVGAGIIGAILSAIGLVLFFVL